MRAPGARALPRPAHLAGLDRYEPGKPIEEVQRELGLTDVVKLALQRKPAGAFPARDGRGHPRARRVPSLPRRSGPRAARRAGRAAAGHAAAGRDRQRLHGPDRPRGARAFLGPEHNAVDLRRAPSRASGRWCWRATATRGWCPCATGRTTWTRWRGAVDEHTRLVFVATPNNPTGTWNRRAEVERLLAALPARGAGGAGPGLLRIRGGRAGCGLSGRRGAGPRAASR